MIVNKIIRFVCNNILPHTFAPRPDIRHLTPKA